MGLLDVFRVGEFKKEVAQLTLERNDLKAILTATGALDLQQIQAQIRNEEEARSKLRQDIAGLQTQILDRRREIVVLDDEILLQSFGLYQPKYAFSNASDYKARLEEIRDAQGAMVKSGSAAHCPTNWTVNNDRKEGERMIRDYSKLILRAFNNECDTAILAVKFSNIASIEKRIQKAFDTLNKLGQRMSISIERQYLKLKLDELHLAYEYQVKLKEEKEEQKRVREQMREEARLQKEIEEARAMLVKEEKHFRNALANIDKRLVQASTDSERTLLLDEQRMIAEKLSEVIEKEREVDYRQQNTRAGYVYIISNVGAFGEGMYKIGVTRRLEPAERIDELSDASVPFDFDTHAIIFSEDAPALENALHKHFASTRVNLVNLRREFFQATLEEIEAVVRGNFSKPVEFQRLAEAAEFRQSQELRRQMR